MKFVSPGGAVKSMVVPVMLTVPAWAADGNESKTSASNVHSVPRLIDVKHLGNDRVIGAWLVDGFIVDPGPESCVQTLLAELGDERPRGLLLTHIHFDHAGATGVLVDRWPDLQVYVHERGAPHMVD